MPEVQRRIISGRLFPFAGDLPASCSCWRTKHPAVFLVCVVTVETTPTISELRVLVCLNARLGEPSAEAWAVLRHVPVH